MTEPKTPQPDHDSLIPISFHIFHSESAGYLAECQQCDWSYAYQDRVVLEAEGQLHLRSHPEYIVITEDEEQALKDIDSLLSTLENKENENPTETP